MEKKQKSKVNHSKMVSEYYQIVKQIPPLEHGEGDRLLDKIRKSVDVDMAKQRLCDVNMYSALWWAFYFKKRNPKSNLDDLVQESITHLYYLVKVKCNINQMENYIKFAQYLNSSLRYYMRKYAMDRVGLGNNPRPDNNYFCPEVISFSDILLVDTTLYERTSNYRTLYYRINRLTPWQQRVIEELFADQNTQAELAIESKTSKQNVSVGYQYGIRRLRKMYGVVDGVVERA